MTRKRRRNADGTETLFDERGNVVGIRYPMICMDALDPLQRSVVDAAGEYGAAPGGTPVRNKIESPDPGVGGYRASTGRDPDGGGTSTLPRKTDPTPYDEYVSRIEGAWRGAPPE